MTLEKWNIVFQFASAVLLGLTFFVGSAAIWTSYVLGKRQGERMLSLEVDLTKQQVLVAEANQKAAESREETAKAFNEAAGANERARKLEMEAATARLETEKLKGVVAWRSLNSQEAAEMERVLSAKPGSVNLRYMDGDPEALFFTIQISKILEKAHWKIASGAVKPNGIVFGVNLPDADNPDRQTLGEALSVTHIKFGSHPMMPGGVAFNVTTVPGAPILMIGSKAPTFP